MDTKNPKKPKKPTATAKSCPKRRARGEAEEIAFPVELARARRNADAEALAAYRATSRGLEMLGAEGLDALQALLIHAEKDGTKLTRDAAEKVVAALRFLGAIADGKVWEPPKKKPTAKKPGGKK